MTRRVSIFIITAAPSTYSLRTPKWIWVRLHLAAWLCYLLNVVPVVQLEALAVLANLTLSNELHQIMVERYQCVPFFVNLSAADNRLISVFATIALGNLARSEEYRYDNDCVCVSRVMCSIQFLI